MVSQSAREPLFSAHRQDDEPWRLARLRAAFIFWRDGLRNEGQRVFHMHDHKGLLSITWSVVPTGEEVESWHYAWPDAPTIRHHQVTPFHESVDSQDREFSQFRRAWEAKLLGLAMMSNETRRLFLRDVDVSDLACPLHREIYEMLTDLPDDDKFDAEAEITTMLDSFQAVVDRDRKRKGTP